MTVDEMKAELREAGYSVGTFRDYVAAPDNTPPLLQMEWVGSLTRSDYIENAYAHLLQSRRMIAMEAFLHKLIAFEYNYQGTDMQVWQKEAKEILGE